MTESTPSTPAVEPQPELPLALAKIVGLGSWFRHPDRPGWERREARIELACPYCGELHRHGWTLGGAHTRTETRLAHCQLPAGEPRPQYRVALDLAARHVVDPGQPILRRCRR